MSLSTWPAVESMSTFVGQERRVLGALSCKGFVSFECWDAWEGGGGGGGGGVQGAMGLDSFREWRLKGIRAFMRLGVQGL